MPAEIAPERALEIIAAYGADSRRWPANEREAALLCSLADPVVAAALAEARALDTLLGAWAGDVAPLAPFDTATLIPAALIPPTLIPATPVRPASTRRQRWWVGGAMAAAITGMLLVPALQGPGPATSPAQIAGSSFADVSPVPSATGESEDLADAEVFATVFTPTADEDELI